jgi:hypothetical protein
MNEDMRTYKNSVVAGNNLDMRNSSITISSTEGTPAESEDELARLRQELTRARQILAESANEDEATAGEEAISEIEADVNDPAPQQGRISRALLTLRQVAQTVTSLGQTVDVIHELVKHL